MKKTILILGIIFLLVGLSINPIVFGFNIRTSIDTPIINMDIPPYQGPPNEIWNKTYEEWTMGDDINFFQQTSDGGYIFTGTIWINHSHDAFLLKTDKDGNLEFYKILGGIHTESSNCIRETNDGGFIFVGYYHNYSTSPYYIWLVKTDENGTMSWDKKYEAPHHEAFGENVIVLDDGYLVMSYLCDAPSIWLIKTDFDGNEIWNKRVGSASIVEYLHSIIQTKDGDFVILGSLWIGSKFYTSLIKVDSYGNSIWRKTFDEGGGYDIVEVEDGSYVIIAMEPEKPCLIKISSDGDKLWSKYYYNSDYWCDSLVQSSDGGFIFVGWIATLPNGGVSAVIVKTDSNGNILWEKVYPVGEYSYHADSVIESDDGNYVVKGITARYDPYYGYIYDFLWLVKLSPFDNLRPYKPSKPNCQNIGKPLVSFTFNTSSYDPDGDILYYTWSWGNGKYTYWVGPYSNNETCQIKYNTWLFPGSYDIKVKAVDIYGGESDWSDPFTITIARDKAESNSLFLRFLDHFPLLQRLLDIWRNTLL